MTNFFKVWSEPHVPTDLDSLAPRHFQFPPPAPAHILCFLPVSSLFPTHPASLFSKAPSFPPGQPPYSNYNLVFITLILSWRITNVWCLSSPLGRKVHSSPPYLGPSPVPHTVKVLNKCWIYIPKNLGTKHVLKKKILFLSISTLNSVGFVKVRS